MNTKNLLKICSKEVLKILYEYNVIDVHGQVGVTISASQLVQRDNIVLVYLIIRTVYT